MPEDNAHVSLVLSPNFPRRLRIRRCATLPNNSVEVESISHGIYARPVYHSSWFGGYYIEIWPFACNQF
jgi:hypothetical protein